VDAGLGHDEILEAYKNGRVDKQADLPGPSKEFG
jgi:hypothetical protein